MKLKAITDSILCTDSDLGDQVTESGIVVKSNLADGEGITPRWFKVFEVGPDIDFVTGGQWVLVEYGRWTEAFRFDDERIGKEEKMWKVDPMGCLAIANEKPNTMYFNTDAVSADKKTL